MELKDKFTPEIVSFFSTLDELETLIAQALKSQVISLKGERYFTNKGLCDLLHVSLRTLQEYRDSGTLGYIRISGKILYKESDVIKLLEDNYINNTTIY